MQTNSITRVHKNKRSISVGRGSKRGKTSGRGTKGQKARSGRKIRPELRDVIKTIPKLRGRGKNSFKSFRPQAVEVNLAVIEKLFAAGETVKPQVLLERGAVSRVSGMLPLVVILGTGEISKKISVSGCRVTAGAKAKIEKVGGVISAK